MDNPLPALRRVVTTHDELGVAVIRSDDLIPSEASGSVFSGVHGGAIWATNTLPADDNNIDVDGATKVPDGDLGVVMRQGANLRFTDLAPGATATLHRTVSLDHNILVHGSLILIMEDGSETLLENPGDVIVQRGTLHGWRNPGPGWARWVTVILDANPVISAGKPLGLELRLD